MRKLILALGLSASAFAQTVSIGVTGGWASTPLYNSFFDMSQRAVIGPTIELRLPSNFALETGMLYRRVSAFNGIFKIQTTPGTVVTSSSRQEGNSYEVPLLGKYYFRPHTARWQPYVATGFSVRKISGGVEGLNTTTVNGVVKSNETFKSSYNSGVGIGANLGAGMRFNLNRFELKPEVRYTRWSDGANGGSRNQNDVRALFGISYRIDK